jgi:hypothetical protein
MLRDTSMNPRVRVSGVLFGAAVVALAAIGAPERSANAQTGAQCAVRGRTSMPPDLAIYDKAQGGRAVARFTGGVTSLVAKDFPSGAASRVAVETGTGTGSFRIQGYVEAAQLPVFTAQDVPVVQNHVWIGAQYQVSVLGASAGKLRVRRSARPPIAGSFTGLGSCGAFTLTPGTPSGWNVPGNARGYVVKKESVELYDAPRGQQVLTLHRTSEGGGILLWSKGVSHIPSAGFVNVEYHDDIVIDAWVRVSDVQPLPPGETMDYQRGSTTKRGTPKLMLQGSTQVVKTTKEVLLRVAAKDSEPVVGRIEADTETYVMDIMAGWASVLPKALNVAPYGELQFWVPAKELGL